MDIKEEILTFIQRKEETGALLITGKWGSGKSYYIKRLAEDLNTNKKEYLCIISLFGIDSVESLTKVVKERYSEANKGFTRVLQKAEKAAKTAMDTVGEIATIASKENPIVAGIKTGISSILSMDFFDFISVKNYIGSDKTRRQFVLVFDDLERCKIDVVDLLGAINEYCENRNIKTIILAAEENLLNNKKSVKKVSWEEGENEKEVLISEQPKSAEEYVEFKEKVIFQTLEFEASYSEIIDAMIDAYKESVLDYVKFLHNNAGIMKQVSIESGFNNLRTIKAIIINFERVYDDMRKIGLSDEVAAKILYGFSIRSFETRQKIQQNEKGDGGEKEQNIKHPALKYNGESIIVYSLQKWIETGRYDKKAVIAELKKIASAQNMTDKDKVLHWPILNLDYPTTVKGLQAALQEAYEGELDGRDYVRLIDRLQHYRYYKIPFDFVDYGKLLGGIEKCEDRYRSEENNTEDGIFFLEDIVESSNDDTRPLIERLEYIEGNCAVWEARLKILRASRLKKRLSYALNVHRLEAFDDELLSAFMDNYKEADNSEKRALAYYLLAIDFIYEGDSTSIDNPFKKQKKINAIETSIANFEQLQKEVESQIESESDLITKTIHREFNGNILKKIQLLKAGLDRIKSGTKNKETL